MSTDLTTIASTDVTGTDTPHLLQESTGPGPAATTTPSASPAAATTDLGAMLSAAIAGGYVAHASGGTFIVTTPIVIHIDSTIQGPLGIDLGGATIISQVTGGAPVIEIDVGPGVDQRYLTLSNFTLQGNGQEGDGIKIVADGNDRWIYNWHIDNVTVNHVGGYGLDVQGSVSEGLVSNSSMNGNGAGGAYFSHSPNGGITSALHWFGGGFEGNGGDGLVLDNGARDMSVDGVDFADNHGVGISAASGITSVTDSTFHDNQGEGIWFQGFGNFNDNTFTSSGSQTLGIKGYLDGNATLVGNTSSYTGAGPDPTALADLQGHGQVFATGDSAALVTGANVGVTTPEDGSPAHVVTSDQGVALPALAPITAATTAPVPDSNGTGPLEGALEAAMAGGYVAHLDAPAYTVDSPIVINVTSADQGTFGIDLGGARILSQVAGGEPVIEIVVAPGVHLSSLTLSNFSIQGNFVEGDGIKIVADGADRGIGTLIVDNVNVEHVGGIGLDVIGNVSHGQIANSWMNGNLQGGARFAGSPAGGVAGDLAWEGGGFRLNGVAGMILDNGTHDMVVKGAYFVDNRGPGIAATSGITLVQESGFENNVDAGAIVNGPANFTDVSFSTWGPQRMSVGGYLSDDKVTLTGVGNEYYGSGADPTVVANFQGSGTVAVSGTGTVVTGPDVAVTGGSPVLDGSLPTDPVTVPEVTAGLANDTGTFATDHVTADATLVGAAEAGAVVHFTVDGNPIAETATADAHGAWSYMPVGLADGVHTIVASETNAAGTGSASLTFTLDTTAPALTGTFAGDGSAPELTGTGDADATVHFTVDGGAIAATAIADSSGAWSFTPTGLADGAHIVVASETDAAGNTGSVSLAFTLQPHPEAPVITGMAPGDGIVTLSGSGVAAGDVVEFYDGNSWIGWTRTDAGGHWSYAASAAPDAQHTFGINEYAANGVLHGANKAILGSTGTDTLAGTTGNDFIHANAGNDTIVGGGGADTLTAGPGKVTFAYHATSDSTPGAADTITDFRSGADKIDFTAIAGIEAAGGVPQFQGDITGSGNLTLNAHSVAYLEAGGNTHVLVNTTNAAQTVTASDMHAADMEITLVGVHLGLTATDFHHS
ncbi:Ig-like domain-containing protein [Enhydrobacter sp.]|jgi:hypothetical protein|uniref:Ig-like domain-containing protein n=1 Tax=Enhydrobacter sp. TaxID=1894999 RepID=UPI0026356E8D|nr:Ig-like domain-containing protein [Enhydrobacter sp.]WIM14421.1 MAG: hypothetical protein OJF58_005391 [Enhydrobacter sp.]